MSMDDSHEGETSKRPTIPFADPKIIRGLPDANCPRCKGAGIFPAEGAYKKCTCTVVDFGRKYLTPAYEHATWDRNFDPSGFERMKNIFILCQTNDWRSVVKAYLLKTGMNKSHVTAAPRHFISAFINKSDAPEWQIIQTADLLIINAGFDPNNKAYGSIIGSTLTDRMAMGRETWFISGDMYDHQRFTQVYSFELGNLLKKNMTLAKFGAQS